MQVITLSHQNSNYDNIHDIKPAVFFWGMCNWIPMLQYAWLSREFP